MSLWDFKRCQWIHISDLCEGRLMVCKWEVATVAVVKGQTQKQKAREGTAMTALSGERAATGPPSASLRVHPDHSWGNRYMWKLTCLVSFLLCLNQPDLLICLVKPQKLASLRAACYSYLYYQIRQAKTYTEAHLIRGKDQQWSQFTFLGTRTHCFPLSYFPKTAKDVWRFWKESGKTVLNTPVHIWQITCLCLDDCIAAHTKKRYAIKDTL